MIEERVILKNSAGLNPDLATRFVQIASKFDSIIKIRYEDKEVNAKSIMSLLTLAIAPGENFTILAKGEDEKVASDALVKFINTGQGSGYPISKN